MKSKVKKSFRSSTCNLILWNSKIFFVHFQANKIDAALSKYFRAQPNAVDNNISVLVDALPEYVLKCPACSSGMVLKNRENNTSFISCTAYPACRQVIWLPSKVIDARLAPDTCVQVSEIYQ